MFKIERVRDRERKIGYSQHKETENLVRDRKRFEIRVFEIERVNSTDQYGQIIRSFFSLKY